MINAAARLVDHNHPTEKCDESRKDVDITKRLIEAGKIFGIDGLDYIVLGDRE